MVTFNASSKPSGGLCGRNLTSLANSCPLDSAEASEESELIITNSFNGLLGRLAKIDYWDVRLAGKKIIKKGKKESVEAAIRMSEVSEQTGLKREDIEFFCVTLRLIECVEGGEDPLLSFKGVFCLIRIFERFVDQGVICLYPMEAYHIRTAS